MAAVIASDSIQIHTNGEDGDVVTGLQIGVEEDAEVQEALDRLDPETRQVVDEALQQAKESGAEEGGEDDNKITFNDKPWDRETNPLVIGWAPDWVNEWVNDEIEQSPAKGRQIEENPNLIKDKVFDVLPATMFVLLPIVALLFKFWYLFAKKYYIEHLIFALHNHSFLYVILLIVMLSSWVAGLVEPDGEGRLAEALSWIYVAVAIWIPLYFLFSLKRVYQQGWGMTITKYCLIGVSYVFLLSFTTAFVALLSFVLL
jgi:hypothetical protein